jgi:hypothetical protein
MWTGTNQSEYTFARSTGMTALLFFCSSYDDQSLCTGSLQESVDAN